MPECDLASKESILTFLFNQGLIGNYKTYSAYEKQGLEMIEEKLKPAIEHLFIGFKALT